MNHIFRCTRNMYVRVVGGVPTAGRTSVIEGFLRGSAFVPLEFVGRDMIALAPDGSVVYIYGRDVDFYAVE